MKSPADSSLATVAAASAGRSGRDRCRRPPSPSAPLDPESLAAGDGVLHGGIGQQGGFFVAPAERREQHGAVRRDQRSRRFPDRVVFRTERSRDLEVARPRGDHPLSVQGDRQEAERAGVTSELDLAGAHCVPAVEVPDGHRGRRGQNTPLEPLLTRDLVVAEGTHRPAERGHGCGASFDDELREAVQQQVVRPGLVDRRGCRSRRSGDLEHVGVGQTAGEQRRAPRVEIGLAGKRGVEDLEAAGRLQQLGRRLAPALDADATRPRNRSTRARPSSSRDAIPPRPAARGPRRTHRHGRCTALPPATAPRRRRDRPSGSPIAPGTRPRPRARRAPAPGPPTARARPRPRRRAPSRLGAMPRPAIGVGVGVGGDRERTVRGSPIGCRCRPVEPRSVRADGGTSPATRSRGAARPPPAPLRPARHRAPRRLATPAAHRRPGRPPPPASVAGSPRAVRRCVAGSALRCDREVPGRREARSHRPAPRLPCRAAAPAARGDCRASLR